MGNWSADSDVTITLEASLDTDPTGTPVWDYDLTSYMVGEWSMFRGKMSEYDEIAPGWLTVMLRDEAMPRRFDPEYSSGPYYGKLLPMKRVRLTVAVGAFSAVVFTGHVTSWAQTWGEFQGTVALQCVDATRILSNATMSTSAYEIAVLADDPLSYWPLQGDLADEITGARFGGNTPTYETVDPAYPIGAAQAATFTAQGTANHGNTTTTGPRTIEAWFDAHSLGAVLYQFNGGDESWFRMIASVAYGIEIDYSNNTDNRQVSTAFAVGRWDLEEPNHVVATADSDFMYVYVNGRLFATFALTLGSTPNSTDGTAATFSVSVSHLAAYEDTHTEAQVRSRYLAGRAAHGPPTSWYRPAGIQDFGGARLERILDDVGWPAGDRDIDTGLTLHGPYQPAGGPALPALRDVERAGQGIVFVNRAGEVAFRDRETIWASTPAVVFSDDGSDIEYVAGNPAANSVDTIRNIVTVTWGAGAITRRNAASVTAYGEARETLDCPTLPTGDVAGDLTGYVLRLKAEPEQVIPALTVDVFPNTSTNLEAALDREIGDVVQIERTPMSVGSQIVKTAMVLGIEALGSASQITANLYLSPVTLGEDAPYLMCGSSAANSQVGSTNIVPY